MPRFYFDFHGDDGVTIDDDGGEFSGVEDARKEALTALADASRDFARHYADGRMAILIRSSKGPVLEISADFKTRWIARG
ncbi:DUF6894 family protein [Bradyrhizobium sp. 521_C7_N1_3]|jgi:hypothetical protein|uniref:DUF6894 family protein n=1 Tax=Bradyrhizobium sp. 521_C7_N1_3 TaxID=3240368 RepID=UPI003F8B9D36